MQQINLTRVRLRHFIQPVIIVVLIVLLWTDGCSGEPETIKVTVPEVTGKFDGVKPMHSPIQSPSVVKIPGEPMSLPSRPETDPLIAILQAENERLKSEFAAATNKDSLYNAAISLNSFSTEFDDEYLHLTINGIVRGEVQQITPAYKIKERTVDVAIPLSKVRILGGAEIGFDNAAVKGNLMLQNRKGNIISASYDTNGNYWAGYNFTIVKW